MKKIMCDTCGSDNARTYKYNVLRSIRFVDLCNNCISDWVLKHQTKLSEVKNGNESDSVGGKKVLFG
jgi:transposase-like protein